MAKEKSRWDILNERGSKERDKYKEEQDKKKKAAEAEKKKKEEEQKAKDKERKARQKEYEKAPKRTEQMTYEEFARRLNSGEKYDALAREYNAFETDRRLATPGGASQHSSYDELPFEDQFALMMAIRGGSPSNNKYLSSAMQTYKMLEGEARRIAKEYGVTPDDPDYENVINTYIDGMYNDNFVSLDDVRSAMTNMSNANKDAYASSQANKEYADYQKQYSNGPTAGIGGGVAANINNVDTVNAQQASAAREQSPGWSPDYGMYPMNPPSPPTYDNPDWRPSWQKGY